MHKLRRAQTNSSLPFQPPRRRRATTKKRDLANILRRWDQPIEGIPFSFVNKTRLESHREEEQPRRRRYIAFSIAWRGEKEERNREIEKWRIETKQRVPFFLSPINFRHVSIKRRPFASVIKLRVFLAVIWIFLIYLILREAIKSLQ